MQQAIKVGVIADQTGALSPMGGAQANTATLVVDEINAAGGLLPKDLPNPPTYRKTNPADRSILIYAVYSDDKAVFYSFSTNSGLTWTGPIQINQAPSATAIMPWSIACAPGQLNVVWYGTSFFDGTTTPDNYPASAAWYVFFSQNRDAAVAGSKFTQVAASPIVHFGGACESGVTCTGNRDLFDDFGVAVSPTTGLASIAYSDDQPGNTGSDDHTAIATQTGGPKICGGT